MADQMTREAVFARLKDEMPRLRREYGVESLGVYGSFATGKQSESSDVDIIVHLSRPLGLQFVALALHLEDVLGRRVDLATSDCLELCAQNPRRRHIAAEIKTHLCYV